MARGTARCPGCNGLRWSKTPLCVRCSHSVSHEQFLADLHRIDPERAERIRRYQARAALGLPLFG